MASGGLFAMGAAFGTVIVSAFAFEGGIAGTGGGIGRVGLPHVVRTVEGSLVAFLFDARTVISESF